MITLEKIDQVVSRTGVSYQKAKEVLEMNDGDVIATIIYLENESAESSEEDTFKVSQILDTLKEYIRRGNVSKIIIKKEEEVILNLPVTVGAVAVVLAPVAALLGVGVAFVKDINIYIENYKGEIVDINKITKEKIDYIKNKTKEVKETAEQKASNVRDKFTKKNNVDEHFEDVEYDIQDIEEVEEETKIESE